MYCGKTRRREPSNLRLSSAIQELAGHRDLSTTQRYMHLSPAALDAAIRLLETGTEVAAAVEK